jgi:hypothetical protein
MLNPGTRGLIIGLSAWASFTGVGAMLLWLLSRSLRRRSQDRP